MTDLTEFEAPTTLGDYLKRRREFCRISIGEVAHLMAGLASSPQLARGFAEQIEQLETSGQCRVNLASLLHGLRIAFRFDPAIALQFAQRDPDNPDLPMPAICRVCACSWADPCTDRSGSPCGWATADLCTSCAEQRS